MISRVQTLQEVRQFSRALWLLSSENNESNVTKSMTIVVRHPTTRAFAVLLPPRRFKMRENIEPLITGIVTNFLGYLPLENQIRVRNYLIRQQGSRIRLNVLFNNLQRDAEFVIRTDEFMRQRGWFPQDFVEEIEQEE